MVTPMLRQLTGPFPPIFHFEEPWLFYEHSTQYLIDAWDHVCQRAIQEGNAEHLHATRDDYQAVLLAHLKILDGYLLLLSRFAGEHPLEFVDRLIPGRDRLQKHYDALFPRWQTIDDLEAILLERVSLPSDQLKALAAKYPPPQAWYDEAHSASATQE